MPRFRGPEESGDGPYLVFTPHLLPIYRGILSSIVVEWKSGPPADLEKTLKNAASSEPFLRFLDSPEQVELRRVQHTNFVDFGIRTMGNVTIIVSAIDNLVKGAAGQAIQNMNLMCGLDETAGLLA